VLSLKLTPWFRSSEAAKVPATAPGTDLLNEAAHQLRTPLTTLLAQAQDMERRLTLDPSAAPDIAAVHRIATEAQRLRHLIQELLETAAVEKGDLALDLEPVDIADLTRIAAATRAPGVAVEASTPVVGWYDRARMRLALEAVIDNAVRFGDGTEIRVLVWRDGEQAYVAVQDRGSGIPGADLPKVFERSHRGANAIDRSVPGLGLGLYLARKIARAHHGAIAIHSTPLDGTTVTFALPCRSQETTERRDALGA
jgi:signal transduction histidine kinase